MIQKITTTHKKDIAPNSSLKPQTQKNLNLKTKNNSQQLLLTLLTASTPQLVSEHRIKTNSKSDSIVIKKLK